MIILGAGSTVIKQSYNNPKARTIKITTNNVTKESMVVQTTSCPANCPSLSIASAIIAEATATGVPNKAYAFSQVLWRLLLRSLYAGIMNRMS